MRVPVPEQIPAAAELGHVHFVGIGGAALSGIARIMLARGVRVSGCDAQDSVSLRAVRALGADCSVGHSADHITGVDTLVVSTAVREDNPDVVAALAAGVRLLPRSAALESVMQGQRVVAVAGTHGKTTTTSLLTVALRHCGADPSFAIGGDLTATGTNAAQGSGDLFVAEADESDGAFLVYSPYAGIVTNVEADHLDNYGSEDAYFAAFTAFLDRVATEGFIVLCVDDPGAARLADLAAQRGLTTIRVGEAKGADLRAVDLRFVGSTSEFTVIEGAHELGRVRLQIPGRHYVLDALAALAAGLRLGFGFDDLAAGLGTYTGTKRRMEFKGEGRGLRVYDSYAHHPTEIAGDLQAARAMAGEGRVVVAFQPHLVSRTRIFGAAMGAALSAADEVIVMDIYLAREDADPEVSAQVIADHMTLPAERIHVEHDFEAVAPLLLRLARPGDVVLTLGAGTVTTVSDAAVALLEQEQS